MTDFFLKLLDMSITASWLVLAIVILRLVFGRKVPKWLFCALWGLVAIRLVCPFSVESPFSLIPSSEPVSRQILYASESRFQSGAEVTGSSVNATLAEQAVIYNAESAGNVRGLSGVLTWIWIAGVIVMFTYSFVSYVLLRRRVRMSVPESKWIRKSELIESPFVLGIFRPVIYIPFNLDEETTEQVLAHEKAHILRRDHWWKPLGFLLLSVYWFNPVLWIAYIFLCRDIEDACDGKVIKGMEKQELQAYSTALLNCSIKRRSIAACPLAFGETNVKKRIKNIMNYKKPAFWIIIVALVACIAVAICFLTNPRKPEDRQITNSDLGKVYVYEKEGFFGDFTITLKDDNSFTYYEGFASSYIGAGTYSISGDTLVLYDMGYTSEAPWIFVFKIDGDTLIYDKAHSHDFIYVHPDDGAKFIYDSSIVSMWDVDFDSEMSPTP